VMDRQFVRHLPIIMVLFALPSAIGQTTTTASSAKPPSDSNAPNSGSGAPITPGKAPIDGLGVGVDHKKYIIGPEDLLFVKVWREPDFTQPVLVRPDGKITMPLVGEIQAADLSPAQLETSIKEQLSKFMNNPNVDVFVEEVRSKKYIIQGEVNRPGAYPLVTDTTVLEALGNSGGFKEFANLKDIRILRNGKILHFNYKDATKGRNLDQNVLIQNGDYIIIH